MLFGGNGLCQKYLYGRKCSFGEKSSFTRIAGLAENATLVKKNALLV